MYQLIRKIAGDLFQGRRKENRERDGRLLSQNLSNVYVWRLPKCVNAATTRLFHPRFPDYSFFAEFKNHTPTSLNSLPFTIASRNFICDIYYPSSSNQIYPGPLWRKPHSQYTHPHQPRSPFSSTSRPRFAHSFLARLSVNITNRHYSLITEDAGTRRPLGFLTCIRRTMASCTYSTITNGLTTKSRSHFQRSSGCAKKQGWKQSDG